MLSHDEDVQYLRTRAEQFRRLATQCQTPISADLLKIAADLDQKANEIAARLPKRP